jgi:hypothetical protein
VLQPELYRELTELTGSTGERAFFPAYRAGSR